MTKEEITMDLPRWWAQQPTQLFEVRSGDGSVIHVEAHEVSVGSPQPTLSFVRYEIRRVLVTKASGGTKNREEIEEEIDHPVMVYSGSFNAGAWVSFRDVKKSTLVLPPTDLD